MNLKEVIEDVRANVGTRGLLSIHHNIFAHEDGEIRSSVHIHHGEKSYIGQTLEGAFTAFLAERPQSDLEQAQRDFAEAAHMAASYGATEGRE